MGIKGANRLVLAGFFDRTGSGFRAAALPVALYSATGNAAIAGIAVGLSLLPNFFMLPVTSRISSPHIAARAMVVSNYGSVVTAAAMAGLSLGRHYGVAFLGLIAVLSALRSITDTSFGILLRASTPKSELLAVNSRLGFWQNGPARFIGLPLGGFVGAHIPALAFAIDGMSYIAVLVVLSNLHLQEDLLLGFPKLSSHIKVGISGGFTWLRHNHEQCRIILTVFIMNVASGVSLGNFISFALRTYDLPAELYGFIGLTTGFANMCGSAVLRRVRKTSTRTLLLLAVGLQIIAYALALSAIGVLPILFAVLALIGVGSAIWNATSSTEMQGKPPIEILGAVLSIWRGCAYLGGAFGGFSGAVLASGDRLSTMLAVSTGCLILGFMVIAFGSSMRADDA